MMPDMNERLDGIEQKLTTLTEHVKEQFTQFDERFAQVDERFAQVDQRFAQVDQRFAQVDQRFEALTERVQKLQVLGEENAAQIKLIAEVQAHHGEVQERHGAALQRIEEAVEPLKAVSAALENILPDHARRIRALESSRSAPTPKP
jgi:chromosome segregation ATPase